MKRETASVRSAEVRTCDACGAQAVHQSHQTERFLYGSGPEQVMLEAVVPVWSCASCGEAFTDGEAEEIRHEAVCRHLGRLTPRELRNIRESQGLSQTAFAEITGFGPASIKRWETGNQVQAASADRFLRLLRDAEVFAKLRAICDAPAPEVPPPRVRPSL